MVIEEAVIFDQVRPSLAAALDEATAGGMTDPYQLQQVIRRTVGSWVGWHSEWLSGPIRGHL